MNQGLPLVTTLACFVLVALCMPSQANAGQRDVIAKIHFDAIGTMLGGLLVASFVALWLVCFWFHKNMKKEGAWISTRAFGIPLATFGYNMGQLRKLINATDNPTKRKRYRIWVYTLYTADGMFILAFVAFTIWLFAHV
jgi:hypothetical protein